MAADPKALRIIYMGTPDFAVAPLKSLVDAGYNVVAVVTMPDKPAGRGLKLQESAVKKYAVEAGLNVIQPESLKSDDFVQVLFELRPDLGIVVAFKMLPSKVFSLPTYGTFNLHASLLPQYRGAAPINWAIINGETETGVTTFLLNPRMDEGEIIERRTVVIEPNDNAGTMHDKLMKTGAELVLKSVEKLVSDDFVAEPQQLPQGVKLKPAPKIFKETCHIDFNANGKTIINLIRGLSPYPAAWAELAENIPDSGNTDRGSVKIFSATFEPRHVVGTPGTVSIENGKMRIECGDGYIVPQMVQPAGKQRMDVKGYINGLRYSGKLCFK